MTEHQLESVSHSRSTDGFFWKLKTGSLAAKCHFTSWPGYVKRLPLLWHSLPQTVKTVSSDANNLVPLALRSVEKPSAQKYISEKTLALPE